MFVVIKTYPTFNVVGKTSNVAQIPIAIVNDKMQFITAENAKPQRVRIKSSFAVILKRDNVNAAFFKMRMTKN